jgi:hypothetical protein
MWTLWMPRYFNIQKSFTFIKMLFAEEERAQQCISLRRFSAGAKDGRMFVAV